MYVIGNVVLGTYLPWDDDKIRDVMEAYASDPGFLALVEAHNPGVTHDDLKVDAENMELEFLDFVDDVWEKKYHGSAGHPVAYVGVRLNELDECDHMSFDDVKALGEYSPTQNLKARKLYERLPQAVRDVLPPFGVHLVWSSS